MNAFPNVGFKQITWLWLIGLWLGLRKPLSVLFLKTFNGLVDYSLQK